MLEHSDSLFVVTHREQLWIIICAHLPLVLRSWPHHPMQVLFQVALMILKFIESPLLSSSDEAEAIGKLNEFLAELGKKASQENKVELEEEIKV